MFKPTYEELKIEKPPFDFFIIISFKPTYEELKIVSTAFLQYIFLSLSLPMRNWKYL